jgi:hypothetical protein
MPIISDYNFLIEQQSELIEAIDWQEIWPVKKHIILSLEYFWSSFRDPTKEMVKN